MKYLLVAFYIFYTPVVIAQNVVEIIKEVQDKYDELEDMQADFKQIELFKLTGSENETLGKIYIKDGEKFKFQSEDQSLITNGETVWRYNAISKQLVIDKVNKNSSALLPRDMLFKYPKEYYSTLLREEKKNNMLYFVIKLDPKENVHGFIKSLKIWVEDGEWLIHKVETTDVNGNSSLFEISNLKINQKIKDNFFSFNVEEGMNVVDMR